MPMDTLRLHWVRIACGLSALFCTAIYLLVLFRAGCAGDSKTGNFGDPSRALDLEGTGVLFEWLALGLAIATAAIQPGLNVAARFKAGVVVLLAGLVLGTVAGMQVEVQGVRYCSARQ